MKRYLELTIVGLFVVVLAGLALHTPVTVFIESRWPELELFVKAWKEVVMGLIAALLAVYLMRQGTFRQALVDRYTVLIIGIALLHAALLVVFDNAYVSEASGLLIDLRYYLLFLELYVVARYIPSARRILLWASGVGVVVVIGFGLLQATVLPRDILSHVGYSDTTIKPYLTVDLNDAYVRINSTLRGPNPVGAFAVIVLSLVIAWSIRHRQKFADMRLKLLLAATIIAALVVLWASHSRSAWLAVVAACTALLVSILPRRAALVSVATIIVAGALVMTGLFAFRDNETVSNLFFHSNPSGGSAHKSDDGHLESLEYGLGAMADSPAGSGIGSTGSASLYSDSPTIVENQYFFMAHESGWLGLVLQVALFAMVLTGLWRSRRDWLCLGLFIAGVGMALIGVLQPVWADDVVSLYWWGLAGLALGSSVSIKTHGHNTARSSHKKAARTP